jgi:NADH-quinone oxidoreductase subunit G
VIGFPQRGALEIVTFSGGSTYFSGMISAWWGLTTADFRFGARPWEMKTPHRCSQCPVGCNIVPNAPGAL